jgi:uncharacterized protein YukE
MAREGMDVGIITSDGTKMKTIGDHDIPSMISAVNSIVQQLHNEWWGQDANAFVSQWESTDRPNMSQIATEVSTFGQLAVTNANAQSTTSSSGTLGTV